jgi:hypothetical protein
MKKSSNYFVLLAIPVFILSSCERWRCIEGTGNRITETRNLPKFFGVISKTECEVYISIDTSLTSPEVSIEADENVIPFIVTTVRSENIEISTKNNKCLETDLPVYVDIKMPSLDYANLSGSGLITCETLTANDLHLELSGSGEMNFRHLQHCGYIDAELSGSGKIELAGKAEGSSFLLSGSGQIQALDLTQDDCRVNFSGSGTMYVSAINSLKGKLSGSGVIYYRVPYILDINITGSGYIEEY